jgi:hypothetical protein
MQHESYKLKFCEDTSDHRAALWPAASIALIRFGCSMSVQDAPRAIICVGATALQPGRRVYGGDPRVSGVSTACFCDAISPQWSCAVARVAAYQHLVP